MENINRKFKLLVLGAFLVLYSSNSLNAQNTSLKIGNNPTIKQASTLLELESTNKGLLIPRVSLSGILDDSTIPDPANSLVIYNTVAAGSTPNNVVPAFYYWKKDLVVPSNSKWVRIFDTDAVQEPWLVQESGAQATLNSQHIYQSGNVSIGTNTIPQINAGATVINPKFHVAGDISTTGKFWTTNSVYADYVFEKYYDGYSSIKADYKFKSLSEIADFIKKNKHLPGVTPISDIQKNENGYTIDLTKLCMEQLEKIEELYLHTIEQQVEIDAVKLKLEQLEHQLSIKK